MPEIAPFEALRYSDELLRDASSLICPPYDVITPPYQKELYAASSCNAVRLELPCEESPYEAAAARLREWLLEGELVRDPRPALYPYFQTFADPEGNRVTRCGFFAAMRLSEPSEKKVLPHEKTLSGPKADRLNLFRQTRANISPVFGIYADESGRGDRLLKEYAATHEPVLEAELQGVENRMWRITEPELLAELREVLLERTVYIADGHHRYATGLNYRNERADGNSCHTGEEPYNFILTYLANMYDEGLLIFPIHRVVHGLAHFDAEAFLGKLGEQFVLRELDGREALKEFMDREQSSYAYGVVLPGRLVGIVLKGRAEDVLEASCPEAMRRLGLVVLHDAVLGGMLGISREAMASQSNLVYRKDEGEVFRAVESGEAQIGFVVHPTTVRQVLDVSDSGEVMPQKSTFFYPKIMTGLVFHSLG
ncbi:DUF1015 domain-containing protein [Chlorobium phaeovibrioides]|uniref:DUF1015 domain-containing protein n=1 Tax=Chlorobium phaeovibrioides TaxID=1094 RepID=A0A3S0LPI3_CHLPH|nr:DUF1015 domain-containing protein [Chlorobium phaeovibrioides]RTY34612.1 DUF1015 domain-containing protein [Chlorobium phaeovibrioides]RTY37714.1 DUF1015 domain-containing protein [Chlorobium phaeovibrioides]